MMQKQWRPRPPGSMAKVLRIPIPIPHSQRPSPRIVPAKRFPVIIGPRARLSTPIPRPTQKVPKPSISSDRAMKSPQTLSPGDAGTPVVVASAAASTADPGPMPMYVRAMSPMALTPPSRSIMLGHGSTYCPRPSRPLEKTEESEEPNVNKQTQDDISTAKWTPTPPLISLSSAFFEKKREEAAAKALLEKNQEMEQKNEMEPEQKKKDDDNGNGHGNDDDDEDNDDDESWGDWQPSKKAKTQTYWHLIEKNEKKEHDQDDLDLVSMNHDLDWWYGNHASTDWWDHNWTWQWQPQRSWSDTYPDPDPYEESADCGSDSCNGYGHWQGYWRGHSWHHQDGYDEGYGPGQGLGKDNDSKQQYGRDPDSDHESDESDWEKYIPTGPRPQWPSKKMTRNKNTKRSGYFRKNNT